MDGPKSCVYEQAENRLYAQMAVLEEASLDDDPRLRAALGTA